MKKLLIAFVIFIILTFIISVILEILSLGAGSIILNQILSVIISATLTTFIVSRYKDKSNQQYSNTKVVYKSNQNEIINNDEIQSEANVTELTKERKRLEKELEGLDKAEEEQREIERLQREIERKKQEKQNDIDKYFEQELEGYISDLQEQMENPDFGFDLTATYEKEVVKMQNLQRGIKICRTVDEYHGLAMKFYKHKRIFTKNRSVKHWFK
tara:strand:+ start:1008 stop:1649 length:642 start_codon:yes stop_codon:yes gene_type:complete